jgi:hypothetical protein
MSRKKSKNPEIKKRVRRTDPLAKIEGMERFCAQWHYKLPIVKMAKKRGLPGFDTHGNVDPVKLIPALNDLIATGSQLPDGIATPHDWLATEKAKREAIKRQIDEKSVMPTADAEREAAAACAFIDGELQRGENELPPVLAGLPAVECAKILHKFTERLRANAKKKFEEVAK